MNVIKIKLEGCAIIEPEVFGDDRGFFLETYQFSRYQSILGESTVFVQDNYSRSARNVLRGLHFQINKPQGKLVRVVRGKVFDVVVDIRKNSTTFGQWVSVVLSEDNMRQLWIPPGFAHGFSVLSEVADFEYKCTDYYDPLDEGCIVWNDTDLGITWPTLDPIVSVKDKIAPPLRDIECLKY